MTLSFLSNYNAIDDADATTAAPERPTEHT
jgi:hypothetical protein